MLPTGDHYFPDSPKELLSSLSFSARLVLISTRNTVWEELTGGGDDYRRWCVSENLTWLLRNERLREGYSKLVRRRTEQRCYWRTGPSSTTTILIIISPFALRCVYCMTEAEDIEQSSEKKKFAWTRLHHLIFSCVCNALYAGLSEQTDEGTFYNLVWGWYQRPRPKPKLNAISFDIRRSLAPTFPHLPLYTSKSPLRTPRKSVFLLHLGKHCNSFFSVT